MQGRAVQLFNKPTNEFLSFQTVFTGKIKIKLWYCPKLKNVSLEICPREINIDAGVHTGR